MAVVNGYVTLDCRGGVHEVCPICGCAHHDGVVAEVTPSRLDEATWSRPARWVTSVVAGVLGASTIALLHYALFGGVL